VKSEKQIVNLAIVFFVIAIGGLIYLGTNRTKDPIKSLALPTLGPPPTPTDIPLQLSSPSANWKSYLNKKYNFSFKYPPDWKVTESSTGAKVTKLTTKIASKSAEEININIVDTSYEKASAIVSKKQTNSMLVRINDVTLDGIAGYYYQINDKEPQDSTNVILPFESGKKTFLIGVRPFTKTEIFNQLITTVKLKR